MTKCVHRSGFTLIELMLAIALGSLLVYTAVAAFRVASQTVTIANRMCLENSLIRAGMCEAHNQLDFWTNLDDPDDVTNQRLRVSGIDASGTTFGGDLSQNQLPTTTGLAFARMSEVFPPNKLPRSPATASPGSQVPRFATALNPQVLTTKQIDGIDPVSIPGYDRATLESDTGFDPTYVWAPHDPRTWYRGNIIEKISTGPQGQRFGRYGIFTNMDANPTFMTFSFSEPIVPPPPAPPTPTYNFLNPTYSAVPLHTWYPRQLIGLARALGFYGMCEYMPSNTIFSSYASYANGSDSTGGIPKIFHRSGSGFVSGDMLGESQGLYSLSNNRSYGVTNPIGRTVNNSGLSNEYYSGYASDYDSNTALQQFINITIPRSPLLQTQPAHWSVVSVGVGHFVKSAKFVNIAKVRWQNPLTGSLSELTFTGVGSTLRGARMQRRPDLGWAKWDNATTATNDANLDTP